MLFRYTVAFSLLIGKWTISFLPTHPVFLSALARDGTKIFMTYFTDFATLIGPMLDPPTIVHLPISVTKWVWMASLKYIRSSILINDCDKNFEIYLYSCEGNKRGVVIKGGWNFGRLFLVKIQKM